MSSKFHRFIYDHILHSRRFAQVTSLSRIALPRNRKFLHYLSKIPNAFEGVWLNNNFFSWIHRDGKCEARRETLTSILFNGENRVFELNTVSLRHKRKSLLRFSPELVTIVQHIRPDDQLEVRTPIEEPPKQLINFFPSRPGVWRLLGKLRRGYAQLEHELGERERCDSRETCPEGRYCQRGQVGGWDANYYGPEGPVFQELESDRFQATCRCKSVRSVSVPRNNQGGGSLSLMM